MLAKTVIFLAILGFFIAGYISYKKGKEESLVCVVGKKCETVLNSKYNKFFGVRNEILGMFYYLLVIVLSLLFIFGVGSIFGVSLITILILVTSLAVLFSIYLTYIQFFVLRAFCDYCLTSALVNVFILTAELI